MKIPTITAKQAVKEIADIITGKRTVREINESKRKPQITGHHRWSHDGPCDDGCYYETID